MNDVAMRVDSQGHGKAEETPTRTLLLLNDEGIVLASLQIVIERIGFDVVGVCADSQALELLKDKKRNFLLLVQDLQRPLDGCHTAEETLDGEICGVAFYLNYVRVHRPQLPCLFLTAEPEHPALLELLKKCPNCRALGLPASPKTLAPVIAELVPQAWLACNPCSPSGAKRTACTQAVPPGIAI